MFELLILCFFFVKFIKNLSENGYMNYEELDKMQQDEMKRIEMAKKFRKKVILNLYFNC